MMRLQTLLLGALAVVLPRSAGAQEAPALHLVQTIALPRVEGRIDHLAVDLKGQRLFVAALGNNSVEVVDLRTGERIRSLDGFHEPQGVTFSEGLGKLFVSNGGSGVVAILDGEKLTALGSIQFADDADNLRFDAAAEQLYVGFGDGALGIVDTSDGKQLGEVKLAAHPESFQLDRTGTRIYVNIPTAGQISVVDRVTRRVLTNWRLTDTRANFPMALDETDHRLLVGFRKPAKLIVFDTESGKVVASLDCAGDADDIFYDPERKQIYLSGGEGFVDVFAQRDADHYGLAARLPTAVGARTSLWVPQMNRLYVAVPRHGAQGAEVRGYDVP